MKMMVLSASIAVIVAVGGVAIYYGAGSLGLFGSTPQSLGSATSVGSSTQSSPSDSRSSSTQSTTFISNCNASSPPSGCPTGGSAGVKVPSSLWGNYLGFIPAGYPISPKANPAIVFPCPAGMTQAQCDTFKQTCGNGVCDPNETCQSCPLDCSVPGDLVCDPYTGRPNSPATVCQIGQAQIAAGGAEGQGG